MSEPAEGTELTAEGLWLSPEETRDRWADAPMDDTLLVRMLWAAQEQLTAYAPDPLPAPLPVRYGEALAAQVRAMGQSMDRDGDVIGWGDGYAVRVRPLAADVKSLIRPRHGRPRVR